VTKGRRIAGLDLLRGLAIAAVLLRHGLPELFPGAGVVGVVMFFALSGYLITGLVVDEAATTGRLDLARFYRRRARRLVPALLALVLGVVVVTIVADPLHDRDRLGATVLFALTWTGDLPFGHASDATFHLWTLALEEQFHLVWPGLVMLCAARGRPRLALVIGAVGTTVALVATAVWLAEAPDLAYSLPTSWAECFVIGAAVRLLPVPAEAGVPRWLAGGALLGLGLLCVVPLRGHLLTYLAGGPAIATLTAVLLVAWREWESVCAPGLRPLVWLGTVSYAAYLWNYPLTLWLRAEGAGWLAVPLTLLLAAASWRFVERPWQRVAPPVGRPAVAA
jgi:peptidoglycan/LPS O-acetylase OafA/YrhL